MKRLRLSLLLLAAAVEIFMLVACWVVALVSPQKAAPIAVWAERCLPDFSWYIGKPTARGK